MTQLLFNLTLTIILEYLVWLLFFRKEWWAALKFSILVNVFTLPIGTYAVHELEVNWYLVEGIIFATEAVAIYLYWNTGVLKAALASIAANLLTACLFPVLYWLGIDAYPF